MRTLLIDNHDSFTYNLYQYLAACNGQVPTVVRNDERCWPEVQREGFDNIVISPGPGRPQRASDLGLTADALRHADVPILGVCLGHQAMAHYCGATVGLACRPMHGRLDEVSHTDSELFHGIPSPFQAVRYHSLAATHLPPDLEELAWAPDGTLMALRHRHRPWWGVQFHPESVCTEFGARLLSNFANLSRAWLERRQDAVGATGAWGEQDLLRRASRRDPDAEPTTRLSLHVHRLDTFPDPEAVFTQCFADADAAFWLDSSASDQPQGRFSYMGDARGPAAEVLRYRSAPRELQVQRVAETAADTAAPESVFDHLAIGLARRSVPTGAWPFDFVGGYVGYFGYELKNELQEPPQGAAVHTAATPDALWLFADRLVAFDHSEGEAWLLCLDEGPLSPANAQWMTRMRERLQQPAFAAPPPEPPPSHHATGGTDAPLLDLQWRIDLEQYRALILRCQEEILQGETYEVCLTNQLRGAGDIDALRTYRWLRSHNPAPYAAYLKAGHLEVLCASPELFLQLSADRTLESKPIKGTTARGATPEEDARNARFLTEDEKTLAENLMIVDLLRNDLTRVCEVGSVHVPRLFHVESFATVHQLVSTIRGRLREGLSIIDAVRATFPGGSMTGAPKERTMHILDDLESGPRGIYSGSLGFLSLDGQAKLNIVIRTIVRDGQEVCIGAGGAIVAMSDPDAEVQEVQLKVEAQVAALRASGALPPRSEPGAPASLPDGQRH
ncbi:MAG: aminodeoxychorismate synthase component I [Proteobacteria bacterium]|nr:aminodeoxychorismate synthase component I [Pseudomonadota bacterium]